MCLARIYTEERIEENCIMEEASRVESRGNDVEVFSLFGASKTLHEYSIDTVELMESFIVLKKKHKKQAHHNHDHKQNRDSVAGKLEKVLPYLSAHNSGHMQDVEKWAVKAEDAGYKEAAEELKIAINLFQEVNEHFGKALSSLDK